MPENIWKIKNKLLEAEAAKILLSFSIGVLLVLPSISLQRPSQNITEAVLPDFNFGAAGDWGSGTNAAATAQNMADHGVELVVSPGDYAYLTGTDNVNSWWNNQMVPVHGKLFRGALGGHDRFDKELYAQIFKQPPTGPSASSISPWTYSFTYQNVQFVTIDWMIPWWLGSEQGRQQYDFVEDSLANAAANPNIKWKVVYFQPPPYTSPSYHDVHEGIRDIYHPLFDQYGVDLVLNGENHNYQRSYPIKYNSADPSNPIITDNSKDTYNMDSAGPIFAVVGTGGVSSYSLEGQAYYMATQFSGTYGYLNIDIVNNGLTMKGTFHSNSGTIKDQFTIDKSGSGDGPIITNNPPVSNA
jgi:hypothetical protein